MRLCSGKEGGMAVSAVWRLVYFLAHAQRNQGTRENIKAVPPVRIAYGSETPCAPLLKSKSKLLLV